MFNVILEYPRISEKLLPNSPPVFKNNNGGWDDIGPCMKDYAEREWLLTQSRRMLISSCFLENGTIITPLLFYLDLGLVCKKVITLGNTLGWSASTFVHSAVNARRGRDENPNSSVMAETLKLLANSSYGYQFMDRSRHSETKYLSDEKHMELSIIKYLSVWIIWMINCMKWSLSSQKLITMNQKLLDFLSWKMKNWECWSCIVTYLTSKVTSQSLNG